MKSAGMKKILLIIIPVILAALSAFAVSGYASSPEVHAETIEYLDEKKTTVLELTAASAAVSSAITLIPGDTATPIAQELANLSSKFLIVLCAIFLEKYLVTATGYAVFRFVLPIALLLFAAAELIGMGSLRRLSAKLCCFGILIFMVIPFSVKISGFVEETYSSSIQTTIENAEETTLDIREETAAQEEQEEKGVLSGLVSKVTGGISDMVSGLVKKAETVLNNFMEALAVMLVTSCLIPILTLLGFVWMIKMIIGTDFHWQADSVRLPALSVGRSRKKKDEEETESRGKGRQHSSEREE